MMMMKEDLRFFGMYGIVTTRPRHASRWRGRLSGAYYCACDWLEGFWK